MTETAKTADVPENVKEYVRQEIAKAIANLVQTNPNFQPPGGN